MRKGYQSTCVGRKNVVISLGMGGHFTHNLNKKLSVVDVAQSVEPRVVVPVVVGSIPIVHPIKIYCESGGIGRRTGFRFQRGDP